MITAAGVVAGASFWLVAAETAGDVGTQTGACGAFPDPGPPSGGGACPVSIALPPGAPGFSGKQPRHLFGIFGGVRVTVRWTAVTVRGSGASHRHAGQCVRHQADGSGAT